MILTALLPKPLSYLDEGSQKFACSIRILENMISGIPLILGLGNRMSDPYAYVVSWSPRRTILESAQTAQRACRQAPLQALSSSTLNYPLRCSNYHLRP